MTIPSIPTRGRTLDYAAPVYDLLEPLCLLNKQAVYDQTLIQTLAPQAEDNILDLGCGTGLLCQKISTLLNPALGGCVTGIDAAGAMIEAARKKRGTPHCRFEVMAAERLDFSDASFDAIISSLFYHHVPLDLKQQSLHEAFRVLKPGGRLVIADMDKPTTFMVHLFPTPRAGCSCNRRSEKTSEVYCHRLWSKRASCLHNRWRTSSATSPFSQPPNRHDQPVRHHRATPAGSRHPGVRT